MAVRLIASDMDDTLLNSETKISERNAAAIHRAIDKGIIFLIATGRMYVSVKPYADALGLDVPLVTYNGALVKGSRSGKVYYEHPLKRFFLVGTRRFRAFPQHLWGNNCTIPSPRLINCWP